jgi:ABC-type sugar transport system ATPase subunit
MTYSIVADGLVKRFGDTRALDGIDLAVRTGSVFSLLGPNGAGKPRNGIVTFIAAGARSLDRQEIGMT